VGRTLAVNDQEYVELQRYAIERMQRVELGSLAIESDFATRGRRLSSRDRMVRLLDELDRDISLRDNATVARIHDRLQRVTTGRVDGFQVEIPAEDGDGVEYVDLGSSVEFAAVRAEIRQLRSMLLADGGDR